MRARALATVGLSFFFASTASAQTNECPPGSTQKSEGSFEWCEPSVCDSDAQCSAGEVCKPLPLCVQIGAIKPSGAAMSDAGGQRLIATQRCGNDKSCPDTTTCSEKSRCISQAQADKMGLLTPASSSAPAGGAAPAKKSCGCRVAGAPGDGHAGFVVAALMGSFAIHLRRRRRPSPT